MGGHGFLGKNLRCVFQLEDYQPAVPVLVTGRVFAFLARPGINGLRGTEFLSVVRIRLKPQDPEVEAGIGPEVQVPKIGKIGQPNPGTESEPAFESLESHRHGTVERPALAPDGQRQGFARFALVHEPMKGLQGCDWPMRAVQDEVPFTQPRLAGRRIAAEGRDEDSRPVGTGQPGGKERNVVLSRAEESHFSGQLELAADPAALMDLLRLLFGLVGLGAGARGRRGHQEAQYDTISHNG